VVDPAVADVCDTVANIATVDIKQTCKQYLSELCGQKSVVLSHTQYGDVLLTSIMKITVTETVTTKATTTGVPVTADIVGKKTTSLADNRTVEKNLTAPLYNFTEASSYVTGMELTAAGQDMHSQIIVLGQAGDVNSLDSVANNPYVVSNIPNNNALNTWRPRVLLQTFGTSVDTKICAQSALMQELKNIVLSIDLNTWYLNNKLVRPNYMVTVQNSDLYLFNPTKFFIESVVLRGDEKSGTATLNCVLPEAYNHQTPKNVFI
jgi:hypothetical protein